MGRPKGSKNKPKDIGTSPDSNLYTVTVSVNVSFKVTLPSDINPYQYYSGNKKELRERVKKGTMDLDTAHVKRYEW